MAPTWEEEDVEKEKDSDRLAEVIQPHTSWGQFGASQSAISLKILSRRNLSVQYFLIKKNMWGCIFLFFTLHLVWMPFYSNSPREFVFIIRNIKYCRKALHVLCIAQCSAYTLQKHALNITRDSPNWVPLVLKVTCVTRLQPFKSKFKSNCNLHYITSHYCITNPFTI